MIIAIDLYDGLVTDLDELVSHSKALMLKPAIAPPIDKDASKSSPLNSPAAFVSNEPAEDTVAGITVPWLHVPSRVPSALDHEDVEELLRLLMAAGDGGGALSAKRSTAVSEKYGSLVRLDGGWLVAKSLLGWLQDRFSEDSGIVAAEICSKVKQSMSAQSHSISTPGQPAVTKGSAQSARQEDADDDDYDGGGRDRGRKKKGKKGTV